MHFENIINARDLGGLRMRDGKVIRSGRLLRTGHLADATPGDVALLRDRYRLRRIFDFRSLGEATLQPDVEVPGARYVNLPTLDTEAERMSGNAVPAETWRNLPSHIVRLSFTDDFKHKARNLYPSLVNSEFSQLQYAAFFDMILNTEEGAVLWHCSQGKDRTGIGAAFLLSALGADRETIVRDFDRSNETYATLVNLLCREATVLGAGEEELDVIRAFMGVSTPNFCRTLDGIEQQYGSMEAYLKGPLALTREDLRCLRERYLEEPFLSECMKDSDSASEVR